MLLTVVAPAGFDQFIFDHVVPACFGVLCKSTFNVDDGVVSGIRAIILMLISLDVALCC